MPLPLEFESDAQLHVAAVDGIQRPRTRGVIGHRVRSSDVRVTRRAGLPVVDPVSTWCQLGELLELDDLIAVGDYIVSGRPTSSGREPALAALSDLHGAVMRRAGRRGVKRVESALTQIRTGVDSRRETILRLLLLRADLPEPAINRRAYADDGTYLGKPDLSYPELKIAFEYEGDGHRTDARQFRRDIARHERFEDACWRVFRVTARDLYQDCENFISRVRRAIAQRS
ncbi:hypothetical protein OSC27_11745 [Microbacterium sp. STN6]|uniref:hypothetical protein n=1 Tax=Microbacterium sp. STN6 TaxID=2995588 RepID=UPI002260F09A|nr:hypothetical protein [Microbacterium sp. STN6]MCX7522947.1 hypothetical protein [Microbacterium sp. STN6]